MSAPRRLLLPRRAKLSARVLERIAETLRDIFYAALAFAFANEERKLAIRSPIREHALQDIGVDASDGTADLLDEAFYRLGVFERIDDRELVGYPGIDTVTLAPRRRAAIAGARRYRRCRLRVGYP